MTSTPPNPPTDVQIFEGEIADYWLDADGILISVSKNPRRTVENITGNMQLVKSITNNKKLPLLIYLCDSPVPDKATRAFVNKVLPDLYSAMAMVSDSKLSKFIMNFLFGLKPPPIPMKTFSDDAKAKEWLMGFRMMDNG